MFILTAYVLIARYDGIIGPVAERYIARGIEKAEREKADAFILMLDTPGGYDEAMRGIVKKILSSKVPVIVYVYPSGGRAASAGVFICMAAHKVAMAPGTNIGAAHPVSIGKEVSEEMKEKITNDACAYLRSIMEKRGRDASWAEEAVVHSSSLTEKEALERGIIDWVCEDLDDLLEKAGLQDKERIEFPLTMRERFLSRLANPNIAYILFIIGFYGILFEVTHPGAIVPGVVGSISLILAFFAFQTLPINYAGLLLIVMGIVMFILEAITPTNGPLTIGGVVSMVLGSVMLINTDAPFLKISWGVIIAAVATTAAFFIFAVGMGLRALKRKPVSGTQGLVGEEGEARTNIDKKGGTVFVHGELWDAWADEKIKKGEAVIVVEVKGLKLKVKRKEVS